MERESNLHSCSVDTERGEIDVRVISEVVIVGKMVVLMRKGTLSECASKRLSGLVLFKGLAR
jgi:hypothetical protein